MLHGFEARSKRLAKLGKLLRYRLYLKRISPELYGEKADQVQAKYDHYETKHLRRWRRRLQSMVVYHP